jgi:hypothetical protein
MTLEQRPIAVNSLLAPSRGFSGNRRKSGQASMYAVGRQPVHQKRHAEIKSYVLDLNGANNAASKLCELAAQR